jgi:hypothetical protein
MVDVVAGMMVTAVVNQPLQVQPQESQEPTPQPTDEGQAAEAV